MMDKEGIIRVC